MKKVLGYLILALGALIFWPLQIGLSLGGIFYIVTTFMHVGVVAGIITLFVTAFVVGISGIILAVIHFPIIAIGAALVDQPSSKQRKWEKERDLVEAVYKQESQGASPEKYSELQLLYSRWQSLMMEHGYDFSPKEADRQARAMNSQKV